MANLPINENKCLARMAAKGPKYFEQCANKKKCESYCGKHDNCKNPYIPLNTERPIIQQNIENKPVKVYQNETDFYNLDSIKDIPKEYFYEYIEDDKYYAFDIRTLNDYLNTCNELEGYKNPYTHVTISLEKAEEIKKHYKLLEKKGLNLDSYKEIDSIDPDKRLEWRCLGIFQKINELGHYSEYRWFWDLDLKGLKSMYVGLEDLWNYRLYLTKEQRNKIVPKNKPFKLYTIEGFKSIKNLNTARTVLLDQIEKLITSGKPEGKNGNDNKYTGSILVLTALVEISHKAAEIMPHLVPMV
jgi:hypothetical protein